MKLKTIALATALTLAGTFTAFALTSSEATAIITYASAQVGKPYLYGATEGSGKFDCSLLTQMAHKSAKISIPRSSASQYSSAPNSSTLNTKGALSFYKTDTTRPTTITHVMANDGAGGCYGANGSGSTGSVQYVAAVAKNGYWSKCLAASRSW